MKKQNFVVIIMVLVIALALLGYQQGLITIPPQVSQQADPSGTPETTGSPSGQAAAQSGSPGQQDGAQVVTRNGDLSLNYEDIRRVLINVDVNQRQALLENESSFQDFVQQETAQLSLLAAANSNNLADDPNAQFLMQRSAENVLREIYLNKLISTRIPEDFPTGEQINQYYENNRDSLVIEERVSVWQIFLPVREAMTDEDISSIRARAEQISDDIQNNRTDFSTAALNYSQHQASKLNGGYMGILKVSELIPGIDDAVLNLAEGEVSEPVRSEMGFHILRRDEIIPSQPVSLDQVREQIRNLLINQARTRLRNEILQLAMDTYPVEVTEQTVEEWRNRLRSDL